MCTRKAPIPLSVLVAILAICQCQSLAPSKSVNVLLLGNSLTYYNSGLGQMLEHLAASDRPPLRLSATELTMGGVPISFIWDMKTSINALPQGPCDVVVVQDTLGFSDNKADMAEVFIRYARAINAWAKERSARTVLLMEQVHKPIGGTELALAERERIHKDLSKELDADVAPIAVAWHNVRKQRPALNLFAPDNLHPNIAGSYLMACVLYATITKKSPVGLSYIAEGVNGVGEPPSRSDAGYLQNVAWEACQSYSKTHVN